MRKQQLIRLGAVLLPIACYGLVPLVYLRLDPWNLWPFVPLAIFCVFGALYWAGEIETFREVERIGRATSSNFVKALMGLGGFLLLIGLMPFVPLRYAVQWSSHTSTPAASAA